MYCGDFDVAANLRETPLERLVSRVENSWKRFKRCLSTFTLGTRADDGNRTRTVSLGS